jgi:hypothetical protein
MLDAELCAQPPINIHTPSISIQPVPEFKCSICAQTWAQVWQFVGKIGSKRPPYAPPPGRYAHVTFSEIFIVRPRPVFKISLFLFRSSPNLH